MPQTWYVETTGRPAGPYTPAELQTRAALGRLTPDDRVSPDGRRWAKAGRVRGLSFTAPDLQGTLPAAVVPAPARAADGPIPGYTVLGEIGAGASGTVYRATQQTLNRPVALKVVTLPAGARTTARDRFVREAELLAKLQHPGIVSVFDRGHTADCVYLAMELLIGEDLSQHIRRRGRLDERTTWALVRQAAVALAHAAERGVIHRDVKPANLFLAPAVSGHGLPADRPVVKVMDFGLAIVRDSGAADQRLTQTGAVVGTPAYMAPEQFARSAVTAQADIYALGATAFHALEGEPPFTGLTVWDLMVRKTESAPAVRADIGPESARLVADMMAPDPARRIATYAILLDRIDALDAVAAPVGGRPPRPTRPNRRRLLAAAAVVLTAGGGAVLAPPGRPRALSTPAPQLNSLRRNELLSDPANMAGWAKDGLVTTTEVDAEGVPVLTIAGGVGWPYRGSAADRLSLGLDLHRAESAVVTFLPPAAGRDGLALRVSRTDGIQIGGVTPAGHLTPLTTGLPYPPADERVGLVPYHSVELQRTAGRWDVWYEGQYVGGVRPVSDTNPAEIRLRSDGRAVRLERLELDRLDAR